MVSSERSRRNDFLRYCPGTSIKKEEQIASARSRAARSNLPISFQIGAIEQLPFPDQTFDVVLSILMMHHRKPATRI
jgi:2-polyprenyl-3-methyl-5-hydroxy-6-metoxy-1,4-benzoquinol methylase